MSSEPLAALIAQWRKDADEHEAAAVRYERADDKWGAIQQWTFMVAKTQCANELEQLLAVDGGRVSPSEAAVPSKPETSSKEPA